MFWPVCALAVAAAIVRHLAFAAVFVGHSLLVDGAGVAIQAVLVAVGAMESTTKAMIGVAPFFGTADGQGVFIQTLREHLDREVLVVARVVRVVSTSTSTSTSASASAFPTHWLALGGRVGGGWLHERDTWLVGLCVVRV